MSGYYDRIVDVMEELVRFTVLLRPHAEQLVGRCSERKDKDMPVASHVEKAGLIRGDPARRPFLFPADDSRGSEGSFRHGKPHGRPRSDCQVVDGQP